MRLIGCDLHASQQSIAMLDRDTGEIVEKTLVHEGGAVREFYAAIPPPVVVGIEATGSMGWFLRLMEELAIECRVGHPTAIRKAETRQQKHDRRDAALLLQLLDEGRFPAIWMASTEVPGSPSLTAAPSSVGPHADARAERAACDRAGARRTAGSHAVESRRPSAAGVVTAGAAYRASPQRAPGVVSALGGAR